jgi:hypothetical protein
MLNNLFGYNSVSSFVRSCKWLLILCYAMHTTAATAFPRGCEIKNFGYNANYLILNETAKQSFYLIHNRSNQLITMQRMETRGVFMSPPLTAKINPLNWAAFASDVGNFHFRCFATNDEYNFPVDCNNVLEICEYPRVRFARSNKGNYWVSINKVQQQVINDAVAKGIYLKW